MGSGSFLCCDTGWDLDRFDKNTLRLTNREAFIDSIAAFRRAYEPQPRPFDDADECAPALLRFAFSIWRISDMLLFSRRNTS